MVSAEITLADGSRATLTGPTREAVLEKAQWIAKNNPNANEYYTDQQGIPRAMPGGRKSSPSRRESRYTITPPFLGGWSFDVGGPLADISNAAANIDSK